MMEHGFIAPSINIENLDEKAVGLPSCVNTKRPISIPSCPTASALAVPTPLWCSSKFKADLPVGSATRNEKAPKGAFLLELFIEFC